MSFPAGEYYIGDLCYVMGPSWQEMCELFIPCTNDFSGCLDGQFQMKDRRVFAIYSTMYGDGSYDLYEPTNYWKNQAPRPRKLGVDSGSIGIILVDRVDDKTRLDSGAVVTFDERFNTWTDGNGILHFGRLTANTGEYEIDDCADPYEDVAYGVEAEPDDYHGDR